MHPNARPNGRILEPAAVRRRIHMITPDLRDITASVEPLRERTTADLRQELVGLVEPWRLSWDDGRGGSFLMNERGEELAFIREQVMPSRHPRLDCLIPERLSAGLRARVEALVERAAPYLIVLYTREIEAQADWLPENLPPALA
jgi:hypothetical protein